MVYACSTRHQTGDTDSFQLVILLPVQLDSQGTFVPCEARIVWYSAGRTSSRQLRDTTRFSIKLTMPFAKSVNLPHKYYGERLACVARFFLFVNNKKEKRQAERAGLESD
jgi:hypothetical protein